MSNSETSKLYLEETTVRLVAAQVVILAVVILVTGWHYLAFALGIDFAIRAFTTLPSPLGMVSKLLRQQLKIEPVRVFAAPKKFAAAVGFGFSLTIFVFLLNGFTVAAYVTGAVLIFCALLESVFKICVGCYVYDWVVAPFVKAN